MYVYNGKMNQWLCNAVVKFPFPISRESPFYSLLHREFYCIHDCVFLLRQKGDLEKMRNFSPSDWKRILKFHKDKTGYEWCINDLSVNDFYYKERYGEKEKEIMMSVAVSVLATWGNTLKRLFPTKRFCLYLSITEEPFFLNLRFHTYRKGVKFIWGEELREIDAIDQPVMVRII